MSEEILNIHNLLKEVKDISSNSVLSSLLDSIPFGFLVIDIEDNIVYSNEWLKENLNLTTSDFNKNSIVNNTSKDILKKILEYLSQKDGTCSIQKEIKVEPCINNIEWISINIKNITSCNGNYIGKIAIIMDCTIINKTKATHDESIDFFENVKRLKYEFLANINHELRTPLNGIFGIVGLLKNTNLTDQQKKYLGIIQDSSDSLLSTVNNILKFTTFDSSDFELNYSQCSILMEVEQIIQKYSQRANEKKIQILINYFWKNPKLVLADKFKLSKLLENILDNAIKFTKNGYIEVIIEALSETKDSVTLKFSIKDTGIGIEKFNLDKIFLPFSQLENPYTKKYPGIGLGLSIASKITRKMGGKINVKSEINNGTEFNFTLTFSIPSVFEKRGKTIELFKDINVFIITRDDILFKNLQLQFEYWSMTISRISFSEKLNLEEKIEYNNLNQLILIDCSIPKDQIKSFLNCLNTDKKMLSIKCIFMHSLNDNESIKELIDLGISSFIEKPILPSYLIGTFKSALTKTYDDSAKLNDKKNEKLSTIKPAPISNSFKSKVLIVEDDIMNQRVAKEILEKIGAYVDVVGNGKEAILISSKVNYDMIFMDLQIPEINGYATTQAIRTYERGYKYTPIIAFTGYIFEEDKKKCIDCGMDDLLLKPVSFESFRSMLIKWTFQGVEFRDFPIFDYKKARDTIGNIDVLKKASNVFLEDMQKRFYELKDLVDLKNMNDVEMLAHTLKSAAAYIGAERLRALTFYLENAASKKDNGIISALFYKLKPELDKLERTLKDFNWEKLKIN